MTTICRLLDLPKVSRPDAIAAIARIFLAASAVRSFANDAAKATFQERWLGRYLAHDRGLVFVAIGDDGAVCGYLAGCFDDPARTPRFADIGFFADFAHLTPAFPAHLHVNLDASARSGGIGSRLVEAFVDAARAALLPGVHVVTGKGARNAGFYKRLRFVERGSTMSHGKDIVFLGRVL